MHVLMIALSSYNFDPRIIRLSAALVEKNIDVDLFCLRYGDQKKLEIIDGVQVHRIMKNFNQESIFSYVIFSFFFLVKAMFKSILILYKNKTNLVHVHNMPDHLVFSAAFYKIRGIPIILDIHDLTLELFKEKWSEKRYNQFKSVLKFVEKLSVRFASRVITVSEQCAEKLIERGLSDKKLTVVMNAPDSKKFKYDTERTFHVINDNLRLIYIGTVAERYGIHRSIITLKEVVNKIPNTIFDIYGNSNTEYDKYLYKTVDELNLKANVNFNGCVSYELISEKLKKADLALVLSINSEYSNLGIPSKVFEYANVGLPFLITDLKPVKEALGEEAACYVTSEDPVHVAQKIIELCKTPEKRRRMSEKAYASIQMFSGKIMCNRYLNLINSCTINHQ